LLKGFAEVIIAKQRNGPTGSEQLAFLSECARFDNLEQSAPPEPGPQQSFADYGNFEE
jgi:replicative DNA helicase